MAQVKIDVEYCGSCGHRKQFLAMSDLIKKNYPDVKISGEPGKQGSFEIKINDELIYSKLQTMAFPEYNEVVDVIKEVTQGQAPRKITKQQPIDCIIM